MENRDFELRELKFYPFLNSSVSDANNATNGLDFGKITVGQAGAFGFNFDLQLRYEVPSGQEVKALFVGTFLTQSGSVDRWRFELQAPDSEFSQKFAVGNRVAVDHSENWFNYDGNVHFINDQVLELDLTFPSGTGGGQFQEANFAGGVLFRNYNTPEAYEVKYNLTNLNAKTFSNGWDGGGQQYEAEVFGTSETDLVPATGSVKNWRIDDYDAKIKFNGSSSDYQVGGEFNERSVRQSFEVKSLFLAQPYWREALAQNYDQGTKPENYVGDACLKISVELKIYLRKEKDTLPLVIEFDQEMETGWLNENGNGGFSDTSLTDVSFFNVDRGYSIQSLSANETTQFEINLSRITGNFQAPDIVGLQVFKRSDFEEYNESSNFNDITYLASWAKIRADGTGSVSQIGKTEFSSLDSQITNSGKNLTITGTFLPKVSSIERIEIGDEYIILFQFWSASTQETLSILVDTNQYDVQTDEPNLVECIGGRIFDPDELPQDLDNALNDGYSNSQLWNEDGVVAYWLLRQFGETSGLPFGEIKSLNAKLISNRNGAKDGRLDYSDPESYLVIQEVDVPFEIVTTDYDIPLYRGESERAFNLAEDDIFKDLRVNTFGGGGGFAYISVMAGLKINWQYWNKLEGVPQVFFNENDAFNGYNERSSNYSEKPLNVSSNDTFNVKAVLFVECENQNTPTTTTYAFEIPLTIFDYGEDKYTRQGDFPDFTGEIFTEKLDGTDLNGNVLTSEDTVFKVHWINNGRVSSLNPWFMCRIEEAEQPGFDIWELSTLRLPLDASPLQPLDGEITLKTYPDGSGGFWTECLVKADKLSSGVGYKLSARIGQNEEGSGLGFGYSLGFTIGFDA